MENTFCYELRVLNEWMDLPDSSLENCMVDLKNSRNIKK